MQAANEGAQMAGVDPGRSSVGIRVDLPFEQNVNPFVDQVYEHRTFFSRLHHFVIVSDAFVIVPGGIGTVLETHDGLAVAPGPQAVRHAADPGRDNVGGTGRMGQKVDASAPTARWPAQRTSPSRSAVRPAMKSSTCFASTTAGGKRTRKPHRDRGISSPKNPQAVRHKAKNLSDLMAPNTCMC